MLLEKDPLDVWFFVFQVRGESNNRGMSTGCDTDVSAEHIWGDNSGELSGSSYFQLFSLVNNKKHCKYFHRNMLFDIVTLKYYFRHKSRKKIDITGIDTFIRFFSFLVHVYIFGVIFQVVFQACMAGIVFAKFTKPTSRAETLMFSKQVSPLLLYPSLTGLRCLVTF